MKKRKKDEKKPAEPPEQLKKTARRDFLRRTGLTAGGALVTTIAAGATSKGAQDFVAQERLMNPDVFKGLFDQALTDKVFQNDILTRGFKALESRGYQHGVPIAEQALLERSLFVFEGEVAKPKCGVCGVCGLCGLCGEINLGSASAALWALFALA